MNGSRVIARMAGMESMAKTRSVVPRAMRTRSRGVPVQRPFSRKTKWSPRKSGVIGMTFRARRMSGRFALQMESNLVDDTKCVCGRAS